MDRASQIRDLVKKLASEAMTGFVQITNIETSIGALPPKFNYQHYAVVNNLLVLLEPWGWISVINLDTMKCTNQFLAYDRIRLYI